MDCQHSPHIRVFVDRKKNGEPVFESVPVREVGEHTYELIRLSASALIHQRGFEAMSMRQLAEQAGIQAGSLYRYFPSKHCLLFELLCDYFDDLLCAWYEARPRGAAAEQALAAFVDNHLVWPAGAATAVAVG